MPSVVVQERGSFPFLAIACFQLVIGIFALAYLKYSMHSKFEDFFVQIRQLISTITKGPGVTRNSGLQ